jgi:acyl dehydratase
VKPLGVRTFNASDQERFARISGDWNPIHLDAAVARRTLAGKPLVHGIHLVLWGLDAVARERRWERIALSRLEARFFQGVGLGEPVECEMESLDAGRFSLVLRKGNTNAVTIRGELGNRAGGPALGEWQSEDWTGPCGGLVARESADLDFEEALKASGAMRLGFDEAGARELFANCCAALPSGQVATLLATSRLVGMICPGMHSLFGGLSLEFGGPNGPELSYSVSRVDRRGSLIQLAVESGGVRGLLDTYFRPPPQLQPSFAEVRAQTRADEFAGWRALVVGGSRGLGEVAAKIIAAGGGEVCITYRAGHAEAQSFCAEVPGATALKFDVTRREFPELPFAPTHLLYFATPRITAEKTYSPEKFASYCRYYVDGFQFTLAALQERGAMRAIFYPSSVYLEETAPNMAEYCAAKAAAEEMLRHLEKRFPQLRVHAPRLPRMATDQTTGILARPSKPALPVMLEELRKLQP